MQTILIYGKRKIGKSELVKHILLKSPVPSIYYECKQVSQSYNVKSLNEIICDIFNLPTLGFETIEDSIEYVFKRSIDEQIIFALDEYPYLRMNIDGLDSILQSLIDKYKNKSNLTFIILGSSIDIMKNLIEHPNPLYGRIDFALDLKPMDYYESSLFYPSYSYEDKLRCYSVFGGVPYYNRLIDETKSFEDNLLNLVVAPDSRLENEITSFLSSEISKITNANETFLALAKGYSKFKDILDNSYVSSSPTLVDTLDKLIKLSLVEKISPINDEDNKRKMSYCISDPLSYFYYRYIFRYSSQRKIMETKAFYKRYIKEDFETIYVPHLFERICKEYLIRINKSGFIDPPLEKIGKYYYDDPKERKNGEFDIVSYDENGYIFYEVKFRKDAISSYEVIKEIEHVKKTKLNCYKYVFISKSEVILPPCQDNIKVIPLSDIWKKVSKIKE